jgi:hypothetical protein
MAVGAPGGRLTELQREGLKLEEQRKVLNKLPLNSTKYKEAKKVFDSIQARITTLEQQERQKSNAKIAQDRKKLQEALTRAQQYGTADQVTEAQNALDKFNGVSTNQEFQEPRFGPGGESIRPGTPEYETASTTRPTVTPTPTPASTTTPTPRTGGKVSTPTATAEDKKGLWVSYLRTVFSTLDDKTQKSEIDRIFDTAIKQKWDEKTFMEALEGTLWWRTNSPSLIQFFLESNDPRKAGMFAEKVRNQVDGVARKMETLGVSPRTVDPLTGKVVDNTEYMKGIALQAIQNNWSDAQLDSYLSTKSDLIFTGGGAIGSFLDRVNQTAYLYGINLDNNLKKAINTSLLDPLDGRDAQYWINSVKQMAIDAPQNKPFAESLKAGKSLYEVTANYRNQMANLLEVDGSNITWDDLMNKVIVGDTGNARTFADFNKALKQDPLWQYTRNAKETYSNMALDLGRTFGFVS